MRKRAGRFLKGEDGAVTADWVVLTAGVTGLMLYLLVGPIRERLVDVSTDIGEQVAQAGDHLN